MTIFQKISAFFKVKAIGEEIIKEASTMDSASGKPGWKTTEFYVSLIPQIMAVWGAVQGFLPPKLATIISVAGAALYTVARTIAKAVSDIKGANNPPPPSA